MKEHNKFLQGVTDGLPICFGYLSVAFAFGIFAVANGLLPKEAVLISMLNVTSAGQLAAVPIITAGGTLLELAISQLVINMRYALMSVSLSQKLGKSVRMIDRFLIAFVNTDEVFAVASAKYGSVGRKYLYGLILTPYLGWSAGTLIGALAGNILPTPVESALGVAIYAMFVAIVVPDMKKSRTTALCVFFAVALSYLFEYAPIFDKIPGGFAIIICAVLASAVFAYFAPIELGEAEDE